jgi:hypothetical protein
MNGETYSFDCPNDEQEFRQVLANFRVMFSEGMISSYSIIPEDEMEMM